MKRKINPIITFLLLIPITFSSCFILGIMEDNSDSSVDIANRLRGGILMAGQSNMEGNVDTNLYNNIVNMVATQNGDSLKTNVKTAIKNWHQSIGISDSDAIFDFEAQEVVRLKNNGILGNFLNVARTDVWASFNTNTVSGLKNGFGNPIGSELTLGQYLGNIANASISLIKVAHGGTTLYDNWLSPSGAARLGKSVGPLYIELKNRIQSIKSNPSSVNPDYQAEWQSFVWFQGENDCFGQINAQTYEANLRDLIKDVRNEIGKPDLPVVVVELNAWASGLPYGNVILAAQNAVAASDPNVEIVKSNDLSLFYHMDPAAHFIVGERIGKALEKLLGQQSDGMDGLTWCAHEGGSFTLPGTCDVAYGANGTFTYLYNKTGTITFNNSTFGDPVPGVVKAGYYGRCR